jgi:hypothetical protein
MQLSQQEPVAPGVIAPLTALWITLTPSAPWNTCPRAARSCSRGAAFSLRICVLYIEVQSRSLLVRRHRNRWDVIGKARMVTICVDLRMNYLISKVSVRVIGRATHGSSKNYAKLKQEILRRTDCLHSFNKTRTAYKTKEIGEGGALRRHSWSLNPPNKNWWEGTQKCGQTRTGTQADSKSSHRSLFIFLFQNKESPFESRSWHWLYWLQIQNASMSRVKSFYPRN